jgi:archaemetzincin
VREKDGSIKQPVYKYAVWGIFGLGDCPGKASIVSNFRLHTSDTSKYHHRIRTVVLHELGHNFGLPHCPNPHCIMNDANEKIATIDNSSDDYCRTCRNKLGLP